MIQTNVSSVTDAQKLFDEKYITASEVMKTLGISRPTLAYARKVGNLPPAIVVNDGSLFLWEREVVAPYLDAWMNLLKARREV